MAREKNEMGRRGLRLTLLGALAMAIPLGAAAADHTLAETLAKMDEAAGRFKSLSASMQHLSHFEVIHEEETESGTILMKRSKSKDLQIRLHLEKPDLKDILVEGGKVQVYYPNSGNVDKYELGRKRSLVDMFMAQGFGGTSADLKKEYTVKLGGADTVAGESVTRLELTPQSAVMLEEYQRVDLWISNQTGYTLQQKFYEKNGKDYHVITYTNVKVNPEIPDSAFDLKVPKGTKRETVIKK